jgi:hypothetical protein
VCLVCPKTIAAGKECTSEVTVRHITKENMTCLHKNMEKIKRAN